MSQPDPQDPGEPRYDPGLAGWLVRRYQDVASALADPHLVMPGAESRTGQDPGLVRVAYLPEPPAVWRSAAERSAAALAGELPAHTTVDLAADLARPFALQLARVIAAVPSATFDALLPPADTVFTCASSSTTGEVGDEARAATADLARGLAEAGCQLEAQSFVALTHTLPAFLAGGWWILTGLPEQVELVRSRPELVPRLVEELLRLAGPAQAVFRSATESTMVGGARIDAGQRVILRLGEANRDPRRFERPDALDLSRPDGRHLAFGAMPHACAGAPVIRLAAAAATKALLDLGLRLEAAGPVRWGGGYAIRYPSAVPVRLSP